MSEILNGPETIEDRPAADDAVARLLRIAGHRPPVPEWDAAVVKSAARAEWRKKVKSRARRTLALRTGTVLAAAAVVLLFVGPRLWRPNVATLEAKTGSITVTGLDPAEPGAAQPIKRRAVIETGTPGIAGRAALRLASGPSLRLDTNTRVSLVSSTVVTLHFGAVYVDSGAGSSGVRIEIRTPQGEVRDIGTQFEVRYEALHGGEPELRVRVREGIVDLKRDGGSHRATAGVELTVRADGSLVRGTVPLYGSGWDWLLEIAPAFEVEGRPLRELLDWAAREGGWELRFADPALEKFVGSPEAVMYGTVAGSTPEQAVEAMLLAMGNAMGGGLTYRLEDGTLFVERP